MKAIKKFLIIGMVLFAILSCSKDGENGNGEPKAEKGYATGKIVDTQGNPIAGAKIYLDNAAFHDSYINGTTDEKGMYKIKVHQGAWVAYANFKKEYNGKTYSIQAYPDNTDALTEDGGVHNFTWKLEGIDPDDDYFYGGRVMVHSANDFWENDEDIELTFTPSGPMIDGSEGKKLVLRYGERYWEKYGYIEDIPVGRYIVTAVLKKSSGEVPLAIQNWYTKGDFLSEFQLDFIPDNSDFRPRTATAIVVGYDPNYIF